MIDLDQRDNSIYKELLNINGYSNDQELLVVNDFYKMNKKEVASYSILVNKLAENGDSIALNILKTAGKDLALQIKIAIEKLNFEEDMIFSYSGSVVTKNSLVLQSILDNLPAIRMIEPEAEVCKAAYYIWGDL